MAYTVNYQGHLTEVKSIEEGLQHAQKEYDNVDKTPGHRTYCFITNLYGNPAHHQHYSIEDGKFVRKEKGDIIERFD